MTDDVLAQHHVRALRTYSDGGVRPIDPRVVAETAIRRSARRRFVPASSPAPGFRTAGTVAVALAAVVVFAVATSQGDESRPGVAGSPSPSPAPASPLPEATEALPDVLPPGPFDINTPAGIVHLTIPAGWRAADGGSALFTGDEPYENTPNAPSLAVHDVTSVVADVCPFGSGASFLPVGTTVNGMVTALINVTGLEPVGPTHVVLGGHPAERFVLALPPSGSGCGGPEGRIIWRNANGSPFGILNGGRATVYVVDVDGVRLVIASHYRGATREEQLQLARIVDSIEIESAGVESAGVESPGVEPQVNLGPNDDLLVGRHPLNVDGIPFSFAVPAERWEQFGRISLNKSVRGPQGAEAMIYWARFPESDVAEPCQPLIGQSIGGTAADLVAAVAAARGTELVAAPSDIEIGGRPATRVVLNVRDEIGCEPGFFHLWKEAQGGASWRATGVGDTIRVWIVELDGTYLFIGGLSAEDAGAELEQEIEFIVGSLRFD